MVEGEKGEERVGKKICALLVMIACCWQFKGYIEHYLGQ